MNADAGTRVTSPTGSLTPPRTCVSVATTTFAWGPPPNRAYQEQGVFEVVDPPHRLVYTSRFTPIAADEGAPLDLHVTVTFQPDGDGTLLDFVESGYPTIDIRNEFLRNGADQGLVFYERTLPSRTSNQPRERPSAE